MVSCFRKVAGAIRVIAGRKSIEPNLPDSLQTRNHLLDDMFSARTIRVEEKKKKKDDADSDSSEDDLDGDDASCHYVEKVGVSDVQPAYFISQYSPKYSEVFPCQGGAFLKKWFKNLHGF